MWQWGAGCSMVLLIVWRCVCSGIVVLQCFHQAQQFILSFLQSVEFVGDVQLLLFHIFALLAETPWNAENNDEQGKLYDHT